MAKCSEYKVTKCYYGDSEVISEANLKSASSNLLDAVKGCKVNQHVFAAFVLQRRQSVETWISQILKYIFANQSKMGMAYSSIDDMVNGEGYKLTVSEYCCDSGTEMCVLIK